MKKFFVVLLALVAGFLAMKSFADVVKVVPSVKVLATPTITPAPVLLADESGVPNDTVITWESAVESKGLKQGDEGYEDARQLCIAYNKAFEDAHQLRADGKLLEAAKKVPLSWVKACYLYNYAASLVADKNDDGLWEYNADKIAANDVEAVRYFSMAKAYSDKAVAAGIVGTDANSPEALNARIEGGLKAINHPPAAKKVKKAAPVIPLPTGTPNSK